MLFDSKDLKLCVYKFNRDEAAGGEDEVGQAAAARRLRLQALKEANELLSTPDEGSRQDETEETEDAEEEMWVHWSSYFVCAIVLFLLGMNFH